MEEKELLGYILSKPTGKYARRIWFLYEFLTGRALPLDDLEQGNYIDLLEPERYYTLPPVRIRRQRVNNNLPGDARFCPLVRRTRTLRDFESADLSERCRRTLETYLPELLRRALGYLYAKETKSSFEIKHDTPSPTRRERFVALLRRRYGARETGRLSAPNRKESLLPPRAFTIRLPTALPSFNPEQPSDAEKTASNRQTRGTDNLFDL